MLLAILLASSIVSTLAMSASTMLPVLTMILPMQSRELWLTQRQSNQALLGRFQKEESPGLRFGGVPRLPTHRMGSGSNPSRANHNPHSASLLG